MKSLEKTRERRYGSASDFAADIERHLRHEPIRARPPSLVYHARKFVRRHDTACAAFVTCLVGGLAFAAWLWQERRAVTTPPPATAKTESSAVGLTPTSPSPANNFSKQYVFSTIAGQPGKRGTRDGSGSEAQFYGSVHLAVDASGSLLISEYATHRIRRLTADGQVRTLAGANGVAGADDGPALSARFNGPSAIAFDRAGNLYLTDQKNHTVRKIDPAGVVTTLAGRAGEPGNADGPAESARFQEPAGIAVDAAGNVFVSDRRNYTIRKISPAGLVTTLAGRLATPGSSDGLGAEAQFRGAGGMAIDEAGNLYVCDQGNHTVRKVTPTGRVTTYAGRFGSPGTVDGRGQGALLNGPLEVAIDRAGNLFVATHQGHAVRLITPEREVRTLGGVGGKAGYTEGEWRTARFRSPSGIAVDRAGVLYVGDTNANFVLRKGVPITSLAAGPVTSPTSALDYTKRGRTRLDQGDYDGALSDLDAAISLDPAASGALSVRAAIRQAKGDFAGAVSDLTQTISALGNRATHSRLQLFLNLRRLQRAEAVTELAAALPHWPAQNENWSRTIAGYLLGQITEADLLAGADRRGTAEFTAGAYYYIGMTRLLDNKRDEARTWLEKCVAANQQNLIVGPLARAELARLNDGR